MGVRQPLPSDIEAEGARDSATAAGNGAVTSGAPGGSFMSPDVLAALGNSRGGTQNPVRSALSSLYGGQLFGNNEPRPEDLGASVPMTGLGVSRSIGQSASTLSDVMASVQDLDEAQINFLQRRLFQAGFYGSSVYGNAASIRWGLMDEATIQALNQAITVAGVNGVEDFDRFLENERIRFGRDGTTANGENIAGMIAGDRQVNVSLTDPDSVRIMAEQSALTLLGRKPTEQELSQITEALWNEQRASAKAGAKAQNAEAGINGELTANLLMDGGRSIPQDWDPDASDVDELSVEQVDNVRTIVDVGRRMGLSQEYIIGAISAGIVESGLTNVNYGDRDSLGVFQQRPSQGWGTPQQVTDVEYAARKFYEAMLTKSGATLGEWVANTQRPAKKYRGRYADVMNDAARIYRQMGGTEGGHRLTPYRGQGASKSGDLMGKRRGWGGDRPGHASMRPVQDDPPSDIGVPSSGVGRDETGSSPMWFDALLGGSNRDTIYNEVFAVDPGASIEMGLRNAAPKDYETKQVASQAYEFFNMLRGIGA